MFSTACGFSLKAQVIEKIKKDLSQPFSTYSASQKNQSLSIFDYATLKHDISAVIYSSISSYTSLERAKIKLSEKKYFGLRKPIIFRTKKKLK